jgi:hypothetical protein
MNFQEDYFCLLWEMSEPLGEISNNLTLKEIAYLNTTASD